MTDPKLHTTMVWQHTPAYGRIVSMVVHKGQLFVATESSVFLLSPPTPLETQLEEEASEEQQS